MKHIRPINELDDQTKSDGSLDSLIGSSKNAVVLFLKVKSNKAMNQLNTVADKFNLELIIPDKNDNMVLFVPKDGGHPAVLGELEKYLDI